MRKFLFSILAVLLVAGIANAANIPTGIDPRDATGTPEVWTTVVENNYTAAITSKSVVIWDWDTSDSGISEEFDDRLNQITLSATNDNPYIAGVILDDSCAVGALCTMAIKGPVLVRTDCNTTGASPLTAGDLCSNSTTVGRVDDWADAADAGTLGYCIKADTAAYCGSFGGRDIAVVYVDPDHAD